MQEALNSMLSVTGGARGNIVWLLTFLDLFWIVMSIPCCIFLSVYIYFSSFSTNKWKQKWHRLASYRSKCWYLVVNPAPRQWPFTFYVQTHTKEMCAEHWGKQMRVPGGCEGFEGPSIPYIFGNWVTCGHYCLASHRNSVNTVCWIDLVAVWKGRGRYKRNIHLSFILRNCEWLRGTYLTWRLSLSLLCFLPSFVSLHTW